MQMAAVESHSESGRSLNICYPPSSMMDGRTRLMAVSISIVVQLACTTKEAAISSPPGNPSTSPARTTRAPFGTLPDGTAIELFTVTNGHGIELRAMTYGAIILSLKRAGPRRRAGRRRARLRHGRRTTCATRPLFRRHRRPIRQPDRARHGSRSTADATAGRQQRPEPSARRPQRVRQASCGMASALPTHGSRVHLHERGWRRRLSRHA